MTVPTFSVFQIFGHIGLRNLNAFVETTLPSHFKQQLVKKDLIRYKYFQTRVTSFRLPTKVCLKKLTPIIYKINNHSPLNIHFLALSSDI